MAPARRRSRATSLSRATRIVEVGTITGPAKRQIDAKGMLVTPGWVDIHTHYDGQATWDRCLRRRAGTGVTTAVMGNCGVGFAFRSGPMPASSLSN